MCARRTRMAEPRSVVITGASRGLGLRFGHAPVPRRAGGWSRRCGRSTRVWRGCARRRVRPTDDAADRRSARPHRLRVGRGGGEVDRRSRRRPVRARAQRRHLRGRNGRGDADEPVGAACSRPHVFGPVALTKALLPSMRAAGRGRIVVVSSAGGVRGMPATAPYSAAKGALERWGESMAGEIAPFGIGVTVLVTGTYDTEIITDAGTTDGRDFDGPYARRTTTMDKRGRLAMKFARPPRAVHRRPGEGAGRSRGLPPHAVGVRMRRCCWRPTGCCRPRGCTTCRDSRWAYRDRARCGTAPPR